MGFANYFFLAPPSGNRSRCNIFQRCSVGERSKSAKHGMKLAGMSELIVLQNNVRHSNAATVRTSISGPAKPVNDIPLP